MNFPVRDDRNVILIDALSALQGGGQTYLINLLQFMPRQVADKCRVILLVPHGEQHRFGIHPNVELFSSEFASKNLFCRLIWSKFYLPLHLKREQVDLLYCPGGFVSVFGNWKTAVAFRNMLPFSIEDRRRYPLGYMRARLAILRWVQARSFRRSDLVIFISLFAKSVIDVVVDNRQGRSEVIPHGISHHFRKSPHNAMRGLPSSYVCYVSILNVYKAQLEVVSAWSMLRSRRVCTEKLLLVGPASDRYGAKVIALIKKLGLQDEVLILGNISYDDLPMLYHFATINLFASSCENCPNILLEALSAGRPVLCSDYQPMPEFAGDAVLYFDPYDPKTLATQLVRVLDDPVLQRSLGQKASERSLQFEWSQSAQRTWRVLAEVASGSVFPTALST